MNEAFVVIDLETTHREPADAHVVEWAALIIMPPWFGQGGVQELGGLVKPPIPIPAETSAVHHITDADVANAPTWEDAWLQLKEALAPAGIVSTNIIVAHNAGFELEMLAKTDPMVRAMRWLCTYKAACRAWPDAPGLGNECLRYFLGLGTGRSKPQSPHSALHDARVTAQLLNELQVVGTPIEDMLAWTKLPAMLPTCPLGDWRGKKWADVDEGFLLWIMRKIHDREDVRFCANAELERREAERAKPRTPSQAAAEDDTVPF